MNALYLTLFVSLVLVLSFALMFGALFAQRSHEHVDRLSLLPLEEEPAPHAPGRTHDEARNDYLR